MPNKPVVLMTGCANGIGFELAKLVYGCPKLIPVITARERHMELLNKEFSQRPDVLVRSLDITNESNIYSLIDEVCSTFGRVDVIVNNAAVCYRSVIEHMDTESERLQMETNYLGPMSLIRAAIPIMREQNEGQIINISSASGILSMPTMASYSASKSALRGASEALWYEAKPFGIKVNLIELGFINSDSFKNVVYSKKAKLSLALNGPHSEYYTSMTPFIERLMRWSPTTPETVADHILRIILDPPTKLMIRGTWDIYLYQLLRALFPQPLFHQFLYSVLPGSVKWGGRWKTTTPALRSSARKSKIY